MDVRILVVPYDSGHRAVRMGRGPLHLIEYGLEDTLESAGHAAKVIMIDSDLEPPTEGAVAFDLARSIAAQVRAARDAGAFPLVLAGNCFSALGTVAGLGRDRTGVLWFDAHADLNTPETTGSAFLDGMAAAALTGRCWTGIAATIPGFAPVADSRVAYIAVRDLDPPEAEAIEGSELGWATPEVVREGLRGADAGAGGAGVGGDLGRILDRFRDLAGLYVHVDLDVLDPTVARANSYAAPNGLDVDHVLGVVRLAASHAPPRAMAVTSLDPAYDDHGRDSAAATEIIVGVLEIAGDVGKDAAPGGRG